MADHKYLVRVVGVVLVEQEVSVTVKSDEPDITKAIKDGAELAFLSVVDRPKSDFSYISFSSAERMP